MKTIKIFLASSNELKPERLELADLVENLNQRLSTLDIHIQLVKWEYLDSSMGPKHKQDEYNDALRDCEMCLVLYWTRFGDYTTIELDTAYKERCAGNNPQKLYVYFKEGANLSPELQAFRDSFPQRYGHFYSYFQNIDTLKAEFLLQFIDFQNNFLQNSDLIEVSDGQVLVGGIVYVDLKNVPFAGNNDEYQLLIKDIKKTQKLLQVTDPTDPDYREYAIELAELKKRQKQMENSLWDTALMITQLSTSQCSERLKRAMDLFSQGDNKGALAVLSEEEIDRDISHNLQLIKLGEEGKKGLSINIDEILLKINALKTEQKEGWYKEVDRLYGKCVEAGIGNLSTKKMTDILISYGVFLKKQNQFDKAETHYKEALTLQKNLEIENPKTALSCTTRILNNLANIYLRTQRFAECEKMYKKSLDIRRKLAADNPKIHEPKVAMTLNNLGLLYDKTRRLAKSEKTYKESLEIRRRLASINPQAYEPDLAMTLNNLAGLYSDTKRYDESEALFKEALAIRKRLASSNPIIYEPVLAITLRSLASLYSKTRRFTECEELLKESLAIQRRLSTVNPQSFEPELARVLSNLASLYSKTRRLADSEECHKEALAIRRRLALTHPQAFEPDLAITLNNLANLYSKTRCFIECEESYREAIEIRKRLAAANPQVYEPELASTLNKLADLYSKTQRLTESENSYMEALEIYRRLSTSNPKTYEPVMAKVLKKLATLYSRTQRYDESDQLHREAVEIYGRLSVKGSQYKSDLARVLGNWAFLKDLMGQFEEAEQLSKEGISIDPTQLFIFTNLASSLLLQGRFDEAEAVYCKYKEEKKNSFLNDFKRFEAEGIIPEERKADVERIKKMLMEEGQKAIK